MYTVEDYLILRGESRKELVTKVREFAEKGFVAQGGVAVILNSNGVMEFYQAISKTVKA